MAIVLVFTVLMLEFRGFLEPLAIVFGGVDYEGHTKQELYERAAKLNVKGRSTMTKAELADAIARQQD